jgi:hypothetical protein
MIFLGQESSHQRSALGFDLDYVIKELVASGRRLLRT